MGAPPQPMSSSINMDRLPATWEKMMLERASGALAQPRPVVLPDELRGAPPEISEPVDEPVFAEYDASGTPDFSPDMTVQDKQDLKKPEKKMRSFSGLLSGVKAKLARHNIQRGVGAAVLLVLAGLGTTMVASAGGNETLSSITGFGGPDTPEVGKNGDDAGLPPLPDTDSLVLPPVTADMMQVGAEQPSIDPANFSAEAPNGPSAKPFSMAGISVIDRGRAVQCLATAIYYEAASEPVEGKQGVAQVVLNRVMHPAFPNTVCGVVYQGSERWTGCQFSFTCDGAMARRPAQPYWDESVRVAQQALSGFVFTPVGWATHYHTWKIWPYWGKTLVSTASVGAHIFHRWRGFWGTPQAFRAAYRGGEPVPGPHTRVGPPPAPASPTTMAAQSGAVTGPVAMPGQTIGVQGTSVPVKAQDFGVVPMPGTPVQAQQQAQNNRAPVVTQPKATVDGARGNLGTGSTRGSVPIRSDVSKELQQSGSWIGEPPR